MPNVPKLHHYLPKAYLELFADEQGDLWVIDRKLGQVRRQRPEVTGAEREMYTVELENDPYRDVEQFLADNVDGPGLRVIKALHAGGQLGADDRVPLATFVAGLYLRTPAFRVQHTQFSEQMRSALLRMGVEPGTAASGQVFEPTGPHEGEGVSADVLLRTIEEARAADRPYQNEFVQMMVGLLPLIRNVVLWP